MVVSTQRGKTDKVVKWAAHQRIQVTFNESSVAYKSSITYNKGCKLHPRKVASHTIWGCKLHPRKPSKLKLQRNWSKRREVR